MKPFISKPTFLRLMLTLSFLLGLLSCSTNPKQASASLSCKATSLKEAYQSAFMMGVAVTPALTSGQDVKGQQLVLQHFNSITPENIMKAEEVSPERGVYQFGPVDELVAFGQANEMFIVGHTLVWHNQTPAWFFEQPSGAPNTPAQQLEQMRKHIEMVAGRYAGKIQAWDVVNEVIDNDGSYRPTTWVKGVGDGDTLVKAAFKYAEQYAPDTELYYNDFNAWRPAKVAGIVRMIKMLQAEGIRIDGVGIQGHWGLNFPSLEDIENAIDAYAATGVKVMITELDVDVLPLTKEGQIIGTGMMHPQFELPEFETFLDPYPSGLPASVEAQLNARYKSLFELFYRKRASISRVTLWGLQDDMSWKNGYPIPNRTNYPLLFDRAKEPKPALREVLSVPSGGVSCQ